MAKEYTKIKFDNKKIKIKYVKDQEDTKNTTDDWEEVTNPSEIELPNTQPQVIIYWDKAKANPGCRYVYCNGQWFKLC